MKLKSLAIGLGFAVLTCASMFAQTSYNFKTINYPDDAFTQLLGINNQWQNRWLPQCERFVPISLSSFAIEATAACATVSKVQRA